LFHLPPQKWKSVDPFYFRNPGVAWDDDRAPVVSATASGPASAGRESSLASASSSALASLCVTHPGCVDNRNHHQVRDVDVHGTELQCGACDTAAAQHRRRESCVVNRCRSADGRRAGERCSPAALQHQAAASRPQGSPSSGHFPHLAEGASFVSRIGK